VAPFDLQYDIEAVQAKTPPHAGQNTPLIIIILPFSEVNACEL
jgi:hypothetical protein